MACKKSFPDVIKLLLDRGANINAVDSSRKTPLHLASKAGLKDIIQLLFENGAKHLGDKDGKTPLHLAVDVVPLDFAALMHINVRTLQEWEQGRRKPRGPAISLLRIAYKHPEIFIDSFNNSKS